MGRDRIELTEKQFEAQVKHLAYLFRWKYYHTWRSIHSPAGFPDCVMIRDKRIVVAELKSEKGKVTLLQEGWLEAFRATGMAEAYLWKPSDFEKIVELLR